MGKVIIDMGMSLDGFGQDVDGEALYPIETLRGTAALSDVVSAAGAVVMGRGAYDMGDPNGFVGYEYQTPIFVVTHRPPDHPLDGENDQLSFTFVTDGIIHAVTLAKEAAGTTNVSIIGGMQIASACLAAGVVDEIVLRVVPRVLGAGRALFTGIDESIAFAPVSATLFDDRTDIHLRVEPSASAR